MFLKQTERSLSILLVEDEARIADFVLAGLRSENMTVTWIQRGDEALPATASGNFDLIILDILLPGCDGLQVLRDLRERNYPVPVLMLTALDSPPQRVEGLNIGADDYLGKPFLMEELIARIRALTRRASRAQTMLTLADLTLDLLNHEVRRAGEKIDVTPREFSLLEFLMRCEGRTVSRTAILLEAWKYNFEPGTNVVDVFIKRLRQKIDGDRPVKLLHTVRHLGYALRIQP